MGTLVCPRCKAKTETDSIENGRIKLDHAIGLYIGKPCGDGVAKLVFTDNKIEKPKSISKKSKINTYN